MHGLRGRTALVTGASRGIGLEVARRLVDEGARVVVTARHDDALQEAVAGLGGSEHALGVAGRADDAAHRAAAVAAAVETFGGVDLLVNNTGISPVYGPLVDLDLEAARKIVEVNALSALGWVQEVRRAGGFGSTDSAGSTGAAGERTGAIVNIASIAGVRPAPGIAMYGASKAMLAHLTADLAVELAPRVRVNAVAPAVVKTRFAARLYEGREDEAASHYPLARLGEPPDVAGPVAFLLSDDAAWITGRVLVIDGGLSLTGGV